MHVRCGVTNIYFIYFLHVYRLHELVDCSFEHVIRNINKDFRFNENFTNVLKNVSFAVYTAFFFAIFHSYSVKEIFVDVENDINQNFLSIHSFCNNQYLRLKNTLHLPPRSDIAIDWVTRV